MACLARKAIWRCFCKYQHKLSSTRVTQIEYVQTRGLKRWHRPVYQALHRRRLEQGPEPERHRSEWLNWNYESELFGFGKRLGEDFNESTLSTAFTHGSYLLKERNVREELEMITSGHNEENVIDIQDNTELFEKGKTLSTTYIKAYLRHALPALPEEGISAICSHVLSDEVVAHVGDNLGIKDLILCDVFPPTTEMLSKTFIAVIGGLARDKGDAQAHLFVQDFLITQLVGKDLMELWPIVNPLGLLQSVITSGGDSAVESRLLYETGSSTILAAYMVGIYSEQQLIGKGYGETVPIAEEMAARDALVRIFGLTQSRPELPLGKEGHELELEFNKVNKSIHDLIHPNELQ